ATSLRFPAHSGAASGTRQPACPAARRRAARPGYKPCRRRLAGHSESCGSAAQCQAPARADRGCHDAWAGPSESGRERPA
nr:hypothetical protein [Tanacetum cinerariifolium]